MSQLTTNFSAHDTNITPILAALGVLIPDEDLPLDRVPFGNPYSRRHRSSGWSVHDRTS